MRRFPDAATPLHSGRVTFIAGPGRNFSPLTMAPDLNGREPDADRDVGSRFHGFLVESEELEIFLRIIGVEFEEGGDCLEEVCWFLGDGCMDVAWNFVGGDFDAFVGSFCSGVWNLTFCSIGF